jgi:DNA-binding response OmpR family regulator
MIISDDTPRTRILIADDHRPTREALRALLEKKNFAVTVVEEGDAARRALTAVDGPCIALLDWMMPGTTGPEICRAIRAGDLGHYVYLIMITAREGEEDITEALAAGADDFIRKPCGVAELLARVRNGERMIALQQNLAGRISELESALARVQQLGRLLPLCMHCKKVRDDSNYWQEIEVYLAEQAGTDFAHALCPDCLASIGQRGPGSGKVTVEQPLD